LLCGHYGLLADLLLRLAASKLWRAQSGREFEKIPWPQFYGDLGHYTLMAGPSTFLNERRGP